MAKLLMINPNTTASITELVIAAARRVASPDTEIAGVTGSFGARYIMTRAASAIAGHAALDAYAKFGDDADAIVLACFGDPGLMALKEIARQPVVGLAEASCLEAVGKGKRFAIVTGGASWKPMLEEFVALLGLSDRLAGIFTVDKSGAEIAADPDSALACLRDAVNTCARTFSADVVVLGGAGLAGIAERLDGSVVVPMIDSVAAGVKRAETLLTASRPSPPRILQHLPTVCLSTELAQLLGAGEH
jgi:Asp/Glu/hydantoin racemase